MSKHISAESTALLKLLLHTVKYAHSAVNGLLIGTVSKSGTSGLEIKDAIPLFHSHVYSKSLSLEVAYKQIEEYAAERQQAIVGYYYAPEHNADTELGTVGRKIADRIHTSCPQAVAVVVCSKRLAAALEGDTHNVLLVYSKDGARGWVKHAEDVLPVEGNLCNLLVTSVEQEKQFNLVDFDDHLEDISKDWTNPSL